MGEGAGHSGICEIPFLKKMSLTQAFIDRAQRAGFIVHDNDVPSISGASYSNASFGIAETGSIVLAASPGEPRAASLLLDAHVSILPEQSIVVDLNALFAEVRKALPSSLAIITGPSRTADIELKLVVGVHGPKEMHIALMRERG